MTPEERGRDFLDFVAQNRERLRRNLIKNVTYEETIFDDVFNDTIIKVYDTIVDKGIEIDDFEKYFFRASKWNFINTDNKERKLRESRVSLQGCMGLENESESTVTGPDFTELHAHVMEVFGERKGEIFFDYLSYKVRGRTSYRKYAALKRLNIGCVEDVVGRIKKHLREKYNKYGLDKETEEKQGPETGHFPEEENGGLQHGAMAQTDAIEEKMRSALRGVRDHGEDSTGN